MRKIHVKNTVRYYLLAVAFLLFLFFTNDFGVTDVQKTAIVVAAGIDREEDTFIITSQIAIPQSSKQGKAAEAVQIVSRGRTVGEAFEEINAKTGWYPKLVFCDLIVLGESAKEADVFDALDFFLRDEYLSDSCLLAVCEGSAKEILNTTALVDPSSSTAIKKVLSAHAERVGTVLPNTLREFAIGYFSESRSGYLPVLSTEPQQETIGSETGAQATASTQDSSSQEKSGGKEQTDKPVFSARQTALFTNGKWVETLKNDETFALATVLSKLRLASYSIDKDETTCTMSIRRNSPSVKLKASNGDLFFLNVNLTMTAGMLDYSLSQSIEEVGDVGDVPKEFFTLAANKLSVEIEKVYEKCRAVGCDVFGVRERLIKYEKRRLKEKQDSVFQNTRIRVSVRFQNVR